VGQGCRRIGAHHLSDQAAPAARGRRAALRPRAAASPSPPPGTSNPPAPCGGSAGRRHRNQRHPPSPLVERVVPPSWREEAPSPDAALLTSRAAILGQPKWSRDRVNRVPTFVRLGQPTNKSRFLRRLLDGTSDENWLGRRGGVRGVRAARGQSRARRAGRACLRFRDARDQLGGGCSFRLFSQSMLS